MDSGHKSFSELVPGDWKFQIPPYQRDYSWEKSQLDDLWRDIKTVHGSDKPHFMGTVLVRKNEDADRSDEPRGHTVYDVIDGQQRLTTLQILVHVITRKLRAYEQDDAQYFRSQYIENRGFKLTLKGTDGRFFKKEILGGPEGMPETSISPDRESQDRLSDTKDFFEEKIESKSATLTEDAFVDYLYSLFDTIKDLEFMAYKVKSASEAVRIFEATNDRGKRLTDLERTKSFLMYHLHLCYEEGDQELEDHIQEIRHAFNDMYQFRKEAVKHGSVPGLDRIQRYHFIIWDDQNMNVHRPPYTDHLSAIKSRFRGMENDDRKVKEIVGYVQELREAFQSVKELKEAATEEAGIGDQLDQYFALNYEANFYPLLIAAWSKFNNESVEASEISRLLDRIEVYTFRAYVIKDYRTNKRKKHFYNRARELRDDEKAIDEIIEKIEGYIDNDCDDQRIRNELREANIYNGFGGQRLRYLLYFYDVSLSKRDEHLHLNFHEVVTQELDNQEISIEHIWPRNPSELELTHEEREVYDKHKHRLGNLALMIGAENSAQSNKPFHKKLDWYRESRIHMLNEVAEPEARDDWGEKLWDDDTWGIEQIERREDKLIDFVLDEWPNYRTIAE